MEDTKETKVWNLTEEEAAELRRRWQRRQGAHVLLVQLQEIEGQALEAEMGWWEAVALNHKIPRKHLCHLVADHVSGKVWVKGEIPALDVGSGVGFEDNPC